MQAAAGLTGQGRLTGASQPERRPRVVHAHETRRGSPKPKAVGSSPTARTKQGEADAGPKAEGGERAVLKSAQRTASLRAHHGSLVRCLPEAALMPVSNKRIGVSAL